MKCLDYVSVNTLDDALAFISAHSGLVVPAAGLTDIMVKARSRDWYSRYYLLDISGIREMKGISEQNGSLHIGALTTAADLINSPIIHEKASILWESCRSLAGPQIRNRATIGGNLANACLAGDMIPPLCVLDARLEIVSPEGSREISVNDLLKPAPACLNHESMTVSGCFYGCPAGKKTTLTPDELITAVILPPQPALTTSRFIKVGVRQMGCMSSFTLAAAVNVKDHIVTDLKLAIGAAFADICLRQDFAEAIIGTTAPPELIRQLADQLGDAIEAQVRNPGDDLRCRAEIGRRLTARTLTAMIHGEECCS